MYYITCDIDWAPEIVIEDFLNLLQEHNVKSTIFATHDSPVLQSCDPKLVEIGIHPNYNPLLDSDSTIVRAEILSNLLNIYPDAKGVRSHSLFQSSNILQDYVDNGLQYDCNQFMPYQKIVSPFKWFNGLVRVPYNWEDDIHFLNNFSFDNLLLDDSDNLNILDFHPIHVYLNTAKLSHYTLAKRHYNNPTELLAYRNNKTLGTRDLFISVLKQISTSETIGELVARFLYEDSYNR